MPTAAKSTRGRKSKYIACPSCGQEHPIRKNGEIFSHTGNGLGPNGKCTGMHVPHSVKVEDQGMTVNDKAVAEVVPKDDPVNPMHYRRLGEYSALHVIHKWDLNYVLGNALKYIQRAGTKPGEDGLTDLRKARWYIQRELFVRDPENELDPADEANRPL